MDSANPSPVRVLIRSHLPSSSQSSSTSGGECVIVIGFVGTTIEILNALMDRVVDSIVFGSSNLDKGFSVKDDKFRDWFAKWRIRYYHDEGKGILYLQHCSLQDSDSEEKELLFMFSVCHVIIYIQDGSRFNTQILKRFRILQAAKNALIPLVRSHVLPPIASKPHSPSSSQPSVLTSYKAPSPGRRGGLLNRNVSSISLMSGLGSFTSLFPGHCTPVTLFVFIDDFSEILNPGSNTEDTADSASFDESSSSSSSARPNLANKNSGPIVLTRPVNNSEGGFQKKLQTTLEAQIRFLIKKCRILSGSESGHVVSKNSGVSSSVPLFLLDASKAVVLLNRCTNQGGASLDFATSLVENVLNGNMSSDALLTESQAQSENGDDILSLKEFIYRQVAVLRGKSGLLSNSSSGSAGMVAIAAAAAAASASSRKTITPIPELPSLEIWLSSSQNILQGILSAKHDHIEFSKIKSCLKNSGPRQIKTSALRPTNPLEIVVSILESGRELNMKFSTLWCERALPNAKEIYLKGLPACYPTLLHEAHLDKALRSFNSMVKGPAVQFFMKQLESECTSVWLSGRQQCDAVSLLGNPCVHHKHVEGNSLISGTTVKPHTSGLVFLHGCACGRSRKLISDPFDFESANVTSANFQDCDKFLPVLQLPKVIHAGPIQPSSWSLIRVGAARYYEPSKGLLQSGFCSTLKFLSKWTIFLEKSKNLVPSSAGTVQISAIRLGTSPKVGLIENIDLKKSGTFRYSGDLYSGVENQKILLENIKSDNKTISFGKGLPGFIMKKPFSEVVAGTQDSGFPPLCLQKQYPYDSEKGPKKSNKPKDRIEEQVKETSNYQVLQRSEDIDSVREISGKISANGTDGEPFLQIGTNVIPVNVTADEKIRLNTSLKHVTVYVGFEHECPHGHRFFLNPESLKGIDSLYSIPEEYHTDSPIKYSNNKLEDPIKLVKDAGHVKVCRHSSCVSRVKMLEKSQEIGANGNNYYEGIGKLSKDYDQTFVGMSSLTNSGNIIKEQLQSFTLDDGGCAFSLLNKNLPIYMNCPYCKISEARKVSEKTMFAGTISQLQRIFLVTPPFPVVLATHPIIQFEASCVTSSVPDPEKLLQFSLGCQVILPPDSFLALRLPFVYGVQLADGNLHPLKPFEYQPEQTAWIVKGTTLHVLSNTD